MSIVAIIFLSLGFSLVIILSIGAYITVRRVTRPRERSYTDDYVFTPFELELPWEDVTFRSQDGLHLRGWFMSRPESRRVMIACSGFHGQKSNLLSLARPLWHRGFNVLAFDLRGQGQSDLAPLTVGYRETGDFLAAVEFVRRRMPEAIIGAFGYSMGGAVVIMAAAQNQAIRAVVADSPFAELREIVEIRFYQTCGLPPRPFVALADCWLAVRYGFRTAQVRPVEAVAHLAPRPLLLIHGTEDEVTPVKHSQALYQRAGQPKEIWLAEGAEHVGAYFQNRRAYLERVVGFFEQHLNPDEVSTPVEIATADKCPSPAQPKYA